MKKISIIFFLSLIGFIYLQAQEWRSELYPEKWQPGFSDSEGRFLHDFSYAGYHSGLKEIPFITQNIVDITQAPYNADKTGVNDATAIIQKAIFDLSLKGGGVVYLPEGNYTVNVDDSNIGIKVFSDNIVIRGAGPDKTFIKNTTTLMRLKNIFYFGTQRSDWEKAMSKEVYLSQDELKPTTILHLKEVKPFKVGDQIIIKSEITPDFRQEMKVGEHWEKLKKGVHFYREIISIDKKNKTIEIDVPTRFFLKTRDEARVYVAAPQLSECGIEDLSIGNVEQPNKEGWAEADWSKMGTGSYDAHSSYMILLVNTTNCWVRNVHTFRPSENIDNIHVLSNCLSIRDSRFVTVKDCKFMHTQGKGGGGNGYLYTLASNDCLITDCYAEDGRHHFDFKNMTSNGNVIHNCYSKDSYLPTDFHMYLSMANLIDCFTADADYIDAKFRPWGFTKAIHMYSTTESVFWNIKGVKAHRTGILVNSAQFGNGYVIGTSGVMDKVVTTPVSGVSRDIAFDTSPEDWVEGEGKGETLVPQSLYLDQLNKRQERLK